MKFNAKYIIEAWIGVWGPIAFIFPLISEGDYPCNFILMAEGYPIWFYNFFLSFELLMLTIICPGIIIFIIRKKYFKLLYAFIAIILCLASAYFFIMSNSVEGFYSPKSFCCMDEMPFKLKDNIIYDQDCGMDRGKWLKRGEYKVKQDGFLQLKISPLGARNSPARITIELKVNFWGLCIPDDKLKDLKAYIDKDEDIEIKKYVFRRILNVGIFGLFASRESGDISKTRNVNKKFPQDKTADSTPAAGTVQRLSSLSPLLGKDIQLYGVSVIASTKEKCLPYFLINNKRNLRVHLGFTNDQAYSDFLKAIKTGSNYKEDTQYAEISGRLQYALEDLSLKKNKKFKEDLEHGELDYPYPSQRGEFTLTNPKVIRIIDKPADADLTVFPIKQTPPDPEGNNIKDACFVGDGNMKKFIEYIEDLKKKE